MAGEAIFIGYRRDDTADVAGRIYDALETRFGRDRVFKDVDNIPVGANFGLYIKSILPRCRVALILMGPHWVDARDPSGKRRLEDPNDWVRIEVETALGTPDLQVVPVLVNGAQMPRAEELPASLQPILHLNAAVIRRDPDFRDDIERLGTALRASVRTGLLDLGGLGGARKPPQPRKAGKSRTRLMIAAGFVLALGVAGFGVSRWLLPPSAETTGEQGATAEPTSQNPPLADADVQQPPAQQPSAPSSPDATVPQMVRIPGQNFEVGRYEVTFAQWDACVAAGGCNNYRPRDMDWGRGNRPVINVSWNDAQSYVQWLSQRTGQRYRLLTSAEWEIAARAGTTTNFSWGDQDPVCDQSARNGGNFVNCNNRTLPVGSFQPNGYGLYDIHGNVLEWVADCPDWCLNRGGSWVFGRPEYLAMSFINARERSAREDDCGFRIARTV